jgi:tetratricopeptide (TPR) repeat protein
MVLCSMSVAGGSAGAENTSNDAAARGQFERGRAAFEATDYEQALVHFRRAYQLSQRGQLQYNIGITASRLQRDDEALQAFQDYLEEVESPPREQEVHKRIAALELAIEEKQEGERELSEVAIGYEDPTGRKESSGPRIPTSAIVGASVLGAVGVAGVAVMSVSLAQSGTCLEEIAGVCESEKATSPWTWVYGGVGVAALAGSVAWLVVSSKRAKEKRNTAWMLTPTGVVVSGSF